MLIREILLGAYDKIWVHHGLPLSFINQIDQTFSQIDSFFIILYA